MATSVRELRARTRSVTSMKKITRAMELIAASRIIKAQQRAQASAPYARELTRAVSAVATYSNVEHVLTTEPENPKRAAILIVTSDRGLAGAYSSNVLKEAERLSEKLREEGKEVECYIAGRKGEAYFRFRNRPMAAIWTGFSDQPTYDIAREIGDALIEAFLAGAGEDPDVQLREGAGPVDEVHVVYTRFRSMLVQEPAAVRLLPLEVVEGTEPPSRDEVLPLYEFEPSPAEVLDQLLPLEVIESEEAPSQDEALPLYEFEPSAEEVLDSLLPQYVQSRIFYALLQSAASELAARQKAMKSATDNADELIKKYTRVANQARQAGITQEISEIVGGVNALADATAGSE
jgi:F-type H+-transporting ATPase subunit gamma